jgi:hypothetical protein
LGQRCGLRLHGENANEHGPGETEGWGQTRGCPTLLANRWSSPTPQTRQPLDDGHRSTVELHGRVCRARERAKEFGWECNWARGVSEWAQTPEKGSGAGDVAKKRAVVGVSTMKSMCGRLGKGAVADRWGPQTSEGERANGRSALTGRSHRAASQSGRGQIGADRPVPPGSGRERGSACAIVADRWGPPVRRRGRAWPG